MEKLQTVILFVAILINESCGLPSGCSITIPTDMPELAPVYLYAQTAKKTFQLFKPTGQTTVVPIGSRLLLACTGSSANLLQNESVNNLELICSHGGVFRTLDNVQRELKNLSCSSSPNSSLLKTSQPCANNRGYKHKVGFMYQPKQFAYLFEVCYDNKTEHTFYTHNVINGAAIKFSIVQSTRRPFSAAGMYYKTVVANKYYSIKNQLSRFAELFGSNQSYITSKRFLARGHLTPDADMIFGYEQLATYYYTNAAPEFQVINAGNWLRVENFARGLAAQIDDDLEVYNGYMGVLQLQQPKKPNTLKPIYLDSNGKIETPEYFFKILQHAATDSAIVMITLNNPYAKQAKIFCTDVCEIAGFSNPYYSDFSRGYTSCCELDDFKKIYADLPATLKASKLLSYSVSG